MQNLVRCLTLVFLCFVATECAEAQSNEELEALGRRLDLLQQSGQHTEALSLLEQLSEALRATFGENSGEYAAILARRAGVLQALGRYKDAEASYLRSRDIATAVLGAEHAGVTFVLNDLALLYKLQGRFQEAEPLYEKALSIREKALGPDHPAVSLVVSNLAALYVAQGRYREAEPLLRRAVANSERVMKSDHPEVAKNLNNLATLFWALGRFTEAEPLYKRALGIVESSFGSEHPAVSTALNNLAALYQDQGRFTDAEPLFQRSLRIREKALGPTHRDVGESANALAWFYHQGPHLYDRAEPLYQRALGISEKALGAGHATVGAMLNNLAVLYYDQGRYAEAEPLFKRAIVVREGALGKDHSDVGQTMYRLARLYQAQKRLPEALALHQRALTVRTKAQGPEHPDVIQSIDGVAHTYEEQGKWQSAVNAARRARDIVVSRAKKGALTDTTAALESGRREITQGREVFGRLVRTLWALAEEQPRRRSSALKESFLAADWAEQTEASTALAQMSVRQAKGNGTLAELIRQRQDLTRQWHALDKQLYISVAQPADKRSLAAEGKLRDQLTLLDSHRVSIDETLKRDFPDFFALSSPEPAAVNSTRDLIRADEALVQFFAGEHEIFIWAISKTGVRWVRSKMSAKALSERVALLRCGLDHASWYGEECPTLMKARPSKEVINGQAVEVLPFDLAAANMLFKDLLAPFDDLIRGKHLMIVPSGALTSIPFQVLVTDRPKRAFASKLADYRKVSWLGTQQPITVLPSVASLKALRQYAKVSNAKRAYLGVGNPLLEGPQDDPQWGAYYKGQAQAARSNQRCGQLTGPQQVASARGRRAVGLFANLYRGGQANLAFLREQEPLPETADELCAVADRLGAPANSVLLGESATEAKLKDLSESGQLADYAILHFATHGALTGQVLGSAEPGLILTPPPENNGSALDLERDDGYLTASEIASLRLDADWVVLSACNTAGSSGESSEALSGLARAFFYAGTRALLVSHWAVGSQAAVKITTRAFTALKSKPSIGRAEALRMSMRDLIEKGTLPEAHPSQWAPFVVVGEGRR